MSEQPTGTQKAGIAMQVTMWLAALCLLAGLAYAIAGPEPEPRPTIAKTGRLFPEVMLEDVYKIRVFDPDGGYEFSRTSLAAPWIVKTLAWSEEATYDAVLRLDTIPCTLDEAKFNRQLEAILNAESHQVHETHISRTLIDKTIPDGPRFVMTAKDGKELAHFVVGGHTRQTGGTFLIVFPPSGEDGTLHEISMPHRPDFNVDRYVSRTEVAELKPAELAAAETPASQQAPIFQDAEWTPEDQKVARELPSGVKIAIKKSGTGRAARATDSMVGHYAGWLEDGTLFDSTVDPRFGHPEPFRLVSQNAMIAGWKEGVVGMRVGEVRKLWIPASMGYGADGTGPVPPNADLIFEIQLLEIR